MSLFLFVCWLLLSVPLAATEISTGFMLGLPYDPQSFYIRTDAAAKWEKTYSSREYRTQARGKLMNLRLAQALFHDEWMTERPFDPRKNTDQVIEALDFYKAHGVLMINVSLQGGQAGYEKAVNSIDRQNGYRFGEEKGTYVSAFRPNGSLKPEWLARLERLLRAADDRGMIVNLMYFYQGQDEVFDSPGAIHTAAQNITDWLIAKQIRNVIIEVANEWDLQGDRWDFGGYIPENIIDLMREIRSRFGRAGYKLPITASSDGRMNYPDSLSRVSDVILIHGNGRTLAQKMQRAMDLKKAERPVLMNEDDNGRQATPENLVKELASCDLFFEHAAGWGYMPWVQAQRFPFRYLPHDGDSEMAYFHDVLDHIAGLTLKKHPHPGRNRERGKPVARR
ncbi:MAG: hypothetical protein WD696_21735 [Bryobacteraceae bacterium]